VDGYAPSAPARARESRHFHGLRSMRRMAGGRLAAACALLNWESG
jgi:hypothetical protein